MRVPVIAAVLAVASPFLAAPALAQDVDPFEDSILHTIELTFGQGNWWNQLMNNYPSDTYIPADLSFDGGPLVTDIGVRLRGEASYYCALSKKKPFRLQMDALRAGPEGGRVRHPAPEQRRR